jgi:hypothetical protein
VSFADQRFQIPISCACVLSFAMDSRFRAETYDFSFLERQTLLPAPIVRDACEQLVSLGLMEFVQDRKTVRLASKFLPNLTRVERRRCPTLTPFTSQYLRLTQHLFSKFKLNEKQGCLDEVSFSHDAVSQLDVDAGFIGLFLCDLERRELIRRSRGNLFPFYFDHKEHSETKSENIRSLIETCASSLQHESPDPVTADTGIPVVGDKGAIAGDPSLLQSALDELVSFKPLEDSSWLLSLVLFVPDHSIKSPNPWTSAFTSSFTVTSMDTFCKLVAPLLVDICKQSSHDSLDVSQIFLKHQGCVASTLIEALAKRGLPQAGSESSSVACKTKTGFCIVCLDDEATLHTPCEGSDDACWKCTDCWANEVETVREIFLFDFQMIHFCNTCIV